MTVELARSVATLVCARPGCTMPLPPPAPGPGRPRRFCSDRCRYGFRDFRARTERQNRSARRVYHRTGNDEWGTPPPLFDVLDALFGPFDLDVAAAAWNAKCRRYFDALANGLAQRWRGRVWCNPPYSEVADWIAKAIVEVLAGHAELVCFLVASRTGTRWWRAAMAHDPWRSFLPGRLRFYGPDGIGRHPAAFDSAVIVIGVPSTFPAVLPAPWGA